MDFVKDLRLQKLFHPCLLRKTKFFRSKKKAKQLFDEWME